METFGYTLVHVTSGESKKHLEILTKCFVSQP